ncbi:hypothetical protein, partial [Bacteroides caccae]|uniref:hypothetical protein n=1 Tax=Bacteroides caccae TaxID=47678 RepID=UPI0010E342CE
FHNYVFERKVIEEFLGLQCVLYRMLTKEKQDPFFYTHKAIGTNNFVQTEITNLSCQIYL